MFCMVSACINTRVMRDRFFKFNKKGRVKETDRMGKSECIHGCVNQRGTNGKCKNER